MENHTSLYGIILSLMKQIAHIYILLCRNRLLLCILNICKDALEQLPKVVGIDVVEMALWAKVYMFLYSCGFLRLLDIYN